MKCSKQSLEADTSALEKQIDVIVYKLYSLTFDEVKIVDPEFGMSKEEYGRYLDLTPGPSPGGEGWLDEVETE